MEKFFRQYDHHHQLVIKKTHKRGTFIRNLSYPNKSDVMGVYIADIRVLMVIVVVMKLEYTDQVSPTQLSADSNFKNQQSTEQSPNLSPPCRDGKARSRMQSSQ